MDRESEKEAASEKKPGGIREEVIDDLIKQIEPHLPIHSMEEMEKKLEAVSVGSRRIPLSLIAGHVDREMFPVKDAKDLRRKILAGVNRAVSLAGAQSFSRSQTFNSAIGALTQETARARLKLPAMYRTYYPDFKEE